MTSAKTFDQLIQEAEQPLNDEAIAPNRRIAGEIVFEPTVNGVRVTARNEAHQLLWGFIGSKETIRQAHCQVAVYETLQAMLAEELKSQSLVQSDNPIADATKALDGLDKTIQRLRDSIDVKKVSDATLERAAVIARIVSDAQRQIDLETSAQKASNPKPAVG